MISMCGKFYLCADVSCHPADIKKILGKRLMDLKHACVLQRFTTRWWLKSIGISDRSSIFKPILFKAFGISRLLNPRCISCREWYLLNYTTISTLQWRHNERDGVWNHQPHDYLLSRLFSSRSKKTSKLRVAGFCAGNSPVTGEFPAQMASNAENASIWWRHHVWQTIVDSQIYITCHLYMRSLTYEASILSIVRTTNIREI